MQCRYMLASMAMFVLYYFYRIACVNVWLTAHNNNCLSTPPLFVSVQFLCSQPHFVYIGAQRWTIWWWCILILAGCCDIEPSFVGYSSFFFFLNINKIIFYANDVAIQLGGFLPSWLAISHLAHEPTISEWSSTRIECIVNSTRILPNWMFRLCSASTQKLWPFVHLNWLLPLSSALESSIGVDGGARDSQTRKINGLFTQESAIYGDVLDFLTWEKLLSQVWLAFCVCS